MKYIDYRSNIKSGDLIAWSARGFNTFHDIIMQLVRLFTRSDYDHVGIAWVHRDRVFVIESVIPYVRIVPLSNLLPCYVVSLDWPFGKDAEERAFSLVGKGKYSVWDAILSIFRLNKNPDKWQCAEFVQEIYYTNGIDLNCIDTPSEVVLAAQKLGKGTVYLE